MGTQRGDAEWQDEVDGWRASGKGADAYAKERGYSGSSLRRWGALKPAAALRAPGFVQLQVAGAALTKTSELVVAVGEAKIVVGRGFDAELLRRVVETLSGGAK